MPPVLREAAYGVGCTTFEVVGNIVIPYTRVGVIGGVMLALGRALGETMAVTFVIGNTNLLDNVSLFSPGNSITSALANEFAEASPGLHTSAWLELGLILRRSTPTDLPAELAVAADVGLTEADRAFVVVASRERSQRSSVGSSSSFTGPGV